MFSPLGTCDMNDVSLNRVYDSENKETNLEYLIQKMKKLIVNTLTLSCFILPILNSWSGPAPDKNQGTRKKQNSIKLDATFLECSSINVHL